MEFRCCAKNSKEAREIGKMYSFLRVIADPNRLRILCFLKSGSKCGCEIVPAIGISEKLVSHHLQQLKKIGLLTDERKGNFIYYNLNKKNIDKYKKLINKIIK